MTRSTGFRLVFALLMIAVLFAGCSRDPNVRKQKYLESGERYFNKGQYREAAIQFSNAIQVDSNFAQGHFQLAQTYLKLQDWNRAYQELSRSLELDPQNYQAHLDTANLLIAAKDVKQAKEHVDLLLEKEPNNPHVHMAAANLLSIQNDIPGALAETQKSIQLDGSDPDSYLNLGLLQMKGGQLDAAEASFKKAVDLNPKLTNSLLALGAFYQARGRFPDADQQFRAAIQNDPKNPEPRAAVAKLLMLEGKRSEAEQFLKQVKQDLPDNSVAYRMLGDFYFATGDLKKATDEYASLYQAHPKDLQVKKNYVQLLIVSNQLDQARKLNDEILKDHPNENDAMDFRGQIQLRDGHPNDALQSLQAALTKDPENGVIHDHLGSAYNQLGDLARAEDEWRSAVRLRPDLLDAHRALAAVDLRKGDSAALEQSADRIIHLTPQSPDGYVLRSAAYINEKDFSKAEQDIQKALDVAPKSPAGYVQMGNLTLNQKKYPEAEKWYRQALDHDANSSDALNGLMNTYLAQKQVDKAVAAARAQVAAEPNNSNFYDLLGTVLFNNKKDLTGAEAALKKSTDLDNNNSDALLKLGQVQVARGSTDDAIATYQNSIKNSPNDASFYILTGELYESKKDWDSAKKMYQKALELKPDNPLASNNLAYVMLQTGGNVDIAMGLAQTARRGMPDWANAADTLGWVYYEKGAYQSAVDLFQEALKLNEKAKGPDDPNVHYHLGLAYEKISKPALAREQLQRVLKLSPNYSDADGVKKALAQLQS